MSSSAGQSEIEARREADNGKGGTAPGDRPPTQNVNVLDAISLICPRQVKEEMPAGAATTRTVLESRRTIEQIIAGRDERLLVIAGPCSIHDEAAALDYARRLMTLHREMSDRLYIVMRVYFEKPRTTVGWKGLINDPYMDGSFNIEVGLRRARQLLMSITEMGMPTGTEMLEPITPQYIADVVSWASIGARTIESQTHRQMASGLSMPVGFKNGTSGHLDIAIHAMQSARHAHQFLGIDDDGRTAVIKTRGNPWGHLVLRGGRSGPNYDPQVMARAVASLREAGLDNAIMVDCSHANSGKKYQNQANVWQNVVQQRIAGNRDMMGILVESNIGEGAQPLPKTPGNLSELRYGVSVTDECIGWEETESLLRWTYEAMGKATNVRRRSESTPLAEERFDSEAEIERCLGALAASGQVFCSKDDFRLALAEVMRSRGFDVQLGYSPQQLEERIHLDLWATRKGVTFAIKLKYKTKELACAQNGRAINLRTHSAADQGRYDFLKDISRLERTAASCNGLKCVALLLTNDSLYWRPGRSDTNDSDFRIHEGQCITGRLAWAPAAGSGSIQSRESAIDLQGHYEMHWRNFIELPNCKNGIFRYLLVSVRS